MTDNFDYEAFKQAAIKGLYEGKPLTGENGLFAPLLKHFLDRAAGAVRFGRGNGQPSGSNPPDRTESAKW